MRQSSALLLVLVALVAWCSIPVEGQRGPIKRRPRPRPLQMPSRLEMTIAINDPSTIDKALACIEGQPCKLEQDYAIMLRRFGPEIMMRGHCPRGVCTREQASEAKWLMFQIYQKYPKKYISTVNRLAGRNPYTRG